MSSQQDRLIEEITQRITQELGGSCGHRATDGTHSCTAANGGTGCLSSGASAIDEIVQQGACRISAGCQASTIRKDLAGMIDHTLLKPNATKEDVELLCQEAAQYGFYSVCVNPAFVSCCVEILRGTGVHVCTVIGFPLGANAPEVKAYEASVAKADGASEVDMVINIGALRGGARDYCVQDIRAVVDACHPEVLLKVILETALLSDDQIVLGCEVAKEAGADYVKTSTGFSTRGADASDVALMRRVVGPEMGVKASGGVGDSSRADLMIAMGATRIGASASMKIVKGGRS
jgi:deoxyribose-phosphate aldolase